ncbi:MAG TPA: PIN domain-containing protein [Solirubrobacterales bacterium]|nr:PIN domain-containing protein [Solirubrobacterales bacterium]
MILADTSAVLQLASSTALRHADVLRVVSELDGPFLLSPFVLAELDYMLGSRHGQAEQLALLMEVVEGAYELAEFGRTEVEAAAAVMRQYEDLRVGLADASIVVLAERHATADVLSFDHRHFRAMRGPGGRPFRLLPDDLPA